MTDLSLPSDGVLASGRRVALHRISEGDLAAISRFPFTVSIREPLDWDIAFLLAPGEARPFRLGESRLGWSGWLDADPAAPVEFVS